MGPGAELPPVRRIDIVSDDASAADPGGPVTAQRFREVMTHVPTPVVVVAAAGPDGPVGLAIGSFVSVSLDPLLVGFLPAKTSSSWPVIRDTGRCCINVLADDQEALCATFATRGGDKFADVDWEPGPHGDPQLAGCVAWLSCRFTQEVELGDHVLAVGEVDAIDLGRDAHALVFHRGGYISTGIAAV